MAFGRALDAGESRLAFANAFAGYEGKTDLLSCFPITASRLVKPTRYENPQFNFCKHIVPGGWLHTPLKVIIVGFLGLRCQHTISFYSNPEDET